MALGQAPAHGARTALTAQSSAGGQTVQHRKTPKRKAGSNNEGPKAKRAKVEPKNDLAGSLDEQWLSNFDPGPVPKDMIDYFKVIPLSEAQDFLTLGANQVVWDAINSGWAEVEKINKAAGIESVPGQFITNSFDFDYSAMLLEHTQNTLRVPPALPPVLQSSQGESSNQTAITQVVASQHQQGSTSAYPSPPQQIGEQNNNQESIAQPASIPQTSSSMGQPPSQVECETQKIPVKPEPASSQQQEASEISPLSSLQPSGRQDDAQGNHGPPAADQQLPASNQEEPAADQEEPAADQEPPAAEQEQPAADQAPSASIEQLFASNREPSVSGQHLVSDQQLSASQTLLQQPPASGQQSTAPHALPQQPPTSDRQPAASHTLPQQQEESSGGRRDDKDNVKPLPASQKLPASLPARLPGPLPDLPSYLSRSGSNSRQSNRRSASRSLSQSQTPGPSPVQSVPRYQPVNRQQHASPWQPNSGPQTHPQSNGNPPFSQPHRGYSPAPRHQSQSHPLPSQPLPPGPFNPYSGQFIPPQTLPPQAHIPQGFHQNTQWQFRSDQQPYPQPYSQPYGGQSYQGNQSSSVPPMQQFTPFTAPQPQFNGGQNIHQGSHPSTAMGFPPPPYSQSPSQHPQQTHRRPPPTPPRAPYNQPTHGSHPANSQGNHQYNPSQSSPSVAAPGTIRSGPSLHGPPPKSWMAPGPQPQNNTRHPQQAYHGPPPQQTWTPQMGPTMHSPIGAPMQGNFIPQMGGPNAPHPPPPFLPVPQATMQLDEPLFLSDADLQWLAQQSWQSPTTPVAMEFNDEMIFAVPDGSLCMQPWENLQPLGYM
ncbi:hypothetical protein BP5796_03720 [Coleophoma crateriformis]|uniref:Uncharacterized protein n=1 Tax=Coleophoma crateriformis TaxID=565419 RepID=A0A3D8SGC9_9HELO|nr:hypothetical protein BP5796_03720 [Coleophoma crateriformis]